MPMIRAELRDLSTTDVLDVDLDQYQPEDAENVCLTVDASIGVAGETGEDIFTFTVCTAAAVADRVRKDGHLFAPNYLILPSWDYESVWKAISDLCRRTEASTWRDVALRIGYFGLWEFYDYDEDPANSGGN